MVGMGHKDHWCLEIACPYKNCGAGKDTQCLIHHNDGTASLRENPHYVRVRHTRKQGHEPEGLAEVREADSLDEKMELIRKHGL